MSTYARVHKLGHSFAIGLSRNYCLTSNVTITVSSRRIALSGGGHRIHITDNLALN
jgi:hypothetical protein